jgi:hypothetical protein
LIALCNWVYYQQTYQQMDSPRLYKEFVFFLKQSDISIARLLLYKVGALYNTSKTKIRLKSITLIVKTISQKSEQSAIYGTANELCEAWSEENSEINELYNRYE